MLLAFFIFLLIEGKRHVHARVQQAQNGDAALARRVKGNVCRNGKRAYSGRDFCALAAELSKKCDVNEEPTDRFLLATELSLSTLHLLQS